MEIHDYASKGVAGAGLGLGIGGTALGLLNSGLFNGIGFGGARCSADHAVNRYEADQSARIAELETEVKLRDANFYTLSEMGKLRDYVDCRISKVEGEICEQKVFNATAISNLSCLTNQVSQLMSLSKLVIPNGSICPGWGEATVSVSTTTA